MTNPKTRNDPFSTYWMPFTASEPFRQSPRLLDRADGMYYYTPDNREILDGIAGLWCVNAGHNRKPIVEAIKSAAERLDFISSFSMSHNSAFDLTNILAERAPAEINNVFLSNSGSEAVDTALKIARGYHRVRGDSSRFRFIGRAKAYHGMGWGGLSVGGISRHRRDFGPLLPGVDHMRHTYDPAISAYSVGQPEAGADYANDLLDLIALHDPSTIAGVIVEPVAGSGGVFPPPVGYLERLREICSQHGILLIFDEVITGFGRLGGNFAADFFGVTPDIICCAKGLTNGSVPMGATMVRDSVREAFEHSAEDKISLFHGYTYSGHPLACAAARATIEIFDQESLWTRAKDTGPIFANAVHALKGEERVVDIRSIGLVAAVDLEPLESNPGFRGNACNNACFEDGVLIRSTGDTLLLSPPLTINTDQIDRIVSTIRSTLKRID